MTNQEYNNLQNIITNLYDSTKQKDYSSKERAGARKFALALKSKLKDIHEKNITSGE